MHKSINFDWQFKPSFDADAIFHKVQDGERVDIPHTHKILPIQYANEKAYQFKSTYQKIFSIDELDAYVFIDFEGVAHEADVYLNGHHLGTHKGGYTKFTYDITKYVYKDLENLLTVFVDARSNLNFPPFGHVIDYLTFGGIYREVSIYTKPKVHIKDYLISTKDIDKVIAFKLEYQLSEPFLGDFRINLTDGDKVLLNETIKVDGSSQAHSYTANHLKLWSIENPKLYRITISIEKENIISDQVSFTYGFRMAEFKPDGFYLNGKRIKLVGLNRHQDYPYVGYAMPKHAQIKDAEILKHDLNLNIVRTSHYPPSKHFIDACDKLGLLVFEEIPGWQYIGDETWKMNALEHVKEMILRDKNSPSVVLWGVRINESGDDDDFYSKTNRLAKKLDDTRQTAGVRFITHSSILEDVYTLNDFIHEGHNIPLRALKDVTDRKDIPYLVTEHTGHMFPTKSFDHEMRRYEHAKRHMVITNHMLGSMDISGSIGWCMHDYYTHIDFGSGDKICYHGVLDMFRNEKPAAYFYQSQQAHTPYLEVSSNFNIGDHNKGYIEDVYIFSNCDQIKVYRNDLYIGDLEKVDTLSHLAFAPYKMDWFGDLLIKQENLDEKTNDFIKLYYRDLVSKGKDHLKESMKNLNPSDELLKKTYDMYGKYVANWGSKSVFYTFKGFIDGVHVITKTKGNDYQIDFKISLDRDKLVIEDTYDVTRITIEALNEHNHRLTYAHDAFEIITDDKLEVIGDCFVSLIGGIRSFWVKTKKTTGQSTLIIKHSEKIYQLSIHITKEHES